MDFTLTIKLEPAVVALLQSFVSAANGGSTPEPAKTRTKKALDVPAITKEVDPTDETDIPGEDAPPVTTTKITVEQVRAAVQAKVNGGKKAEVKALIAEFGVANVTSLQENQYGEFLTKVNAL